MNIMSSEHRAKKLINAPEDIISEAIAGMVGAHPDMLRLEGNTGRAVVALDGPRDGKVGVVVGGGSGHEPAFAGYVGRGLADAAAVGNVFASPSPEQILDATRAVDGGAGVVYLYGNYTGDVMNFDMAAEEAATLGIECRSVAVADDIASAPKGREGERRGIAGDFFVFKIAGAAAEAGRDLAGVEAAAQHALASTRSMGVALTPCSMPQTGKPNFEIGDDEMEIGMGLHGEPGMRRGDMASADEVVDELMAPILDEMAFRPGDEVAVLVNGLGATGLLELYILHRRVAAILAEKGVKIHYSWVGEYATSLEMAGASITLMKLDTDLRKLLDMPCRTPALTVGTLQDAPRQARSTVSARPVAETAREESRSRELATDGPITPALFRTMMVAAGERISTEADRLSALDGVIGDGDHGVTMDIGWKAVRDALAQSPEDETIETSCKRMAKAFLDAVGASSGPLYATAFLRAGTAVKDRLNLDAASMAAWIEAACEGVRERGRAAPGDKTMVDAWVPAVEEARGAVTGGADVLGCLDAACEGAERGMNATRDIESKRGRSSKLGARSVGHIDPGAASTVVILTAMRDTAREALA
ncbi:homodimeric dihydroxyacetone kinase (plasmid) [Salipiger profundus]|jgi:dihydroxyacetone kinase phosphoprotein-dependent L subunit|uniref:Homodimeric dihydroxyacetone kinase n=2 Tax=Salipiger profundus TaxID=1229727 RepID=A0A1U7DCA0_9RHOB|nr:MULTISPECIES: dihydroxyacetone kinase subunit DhaL [Salipiger]APX25791.1 homodimeric dihydroxyacetone kinase [Salipiger profundus]SFC85504.1 homodimeric dihydroxyacetone kinase [Salipiger profundus]